MLFFPKNHVSEMNLASEKPKKGKKDETMTAWLEKPHEP
ncbi:unnamed protein product [Larinioides sclopetarius]|uniref:Uncharacterized protein n=1 Tax=Larinioides sclopetarius TaxID=280406 RepID=A0AAV1Z5W2_9ARAC